MTKDKKDGKLPKRIGGVKVPSDLRKRAKPLLALANQPLAREIALAALLAGLAASKEARKAAKKARAEAGAAASEVSDKVDWVGPGVAAAAVEVGRRLIDAFDGRNGGTPGRTGSASASSSGAAKVIQIVEKLAAGNKR